MRFAPRFQTDTHGSDLSQRERVYTPRNGGVGWVEYGSHAKQARGYRLFLFLGINHVIKIQNFIMNLKKMSCSDKGRSTFSNVQSLLDMSQLKSRIDRLTCLGQSFLDLRADTFVQSSVRVCKIPTETHQDLLNCIQITGWVGLWDDN